MPIKKRIVKRGGPSSRAIAALIDKQIYANPEKVAKDAEKRRIKYELKCERQGIDVTQGPSVTQGTNATQGAAIRNAFQIDVEYDQDMSEAPVVRKHTTTRETWNRYSIEKLINMYVASVAIGKPSLSLTNPEQQLHDCPCKTKRTKLVTLYMMCAHVERTITYCDCKSLVNALFEMQFLPSGGKVPNVAVHFAMLKYLHDLKMVEQTATHGFTAVANMTNEEGKPLKKDVLNNVYLLYRRIINHTTDLMSALFEIKQRNCYSCDGALDKFVTLDGNFQLGRKPTASEKKGAEIFSPSSTSIFSPSVGETTLWGSNDEVVKYDKSITPKECIIESIFDDQDDDSSFKANTNNNRTNNNQGRYVENGVFVMCCADHGVPERMYDIYGGEGHKYALACVAHCLKGHEINESNNNNINIMYDIVCRCKKRLEEEFPAIKGRSLFAVPAFHAYAHSANCQVQFNPRYVAGFGSKDGEGCERLWSYLNRFVCLIRSMTASNRRLTLLDAVHYYRNLKMMNLPSLLNEKYKKTQKTISDTNRKIGFMYDILKEDWKETRGNMNQTSEKRVREAIRAKIDVEDIKYWYYVDVAKYLSIPAGSNHGIIVSVKKRLENILTTKYASLDEVQPSQLEDSRFDAIRDIINEEIARFLRSLLDSYCSFLLLNEYKLSREKTGTAKTGKLLASSTTAKATAQKVRDALIKVLFKCRHNSNLIKFCMPRVTIDQELQRKREAHSSKWANSIHGDIGLGEDMNAFHLLNRAKEEEVFLKEAAERFVENVKDEKINLEKNIKTLKETIKNIIENQENNNSDDEQIAINTGYLYLLNEKRKNNQKLLKEAKKKLKFIVVEIDEDVVEEDVEDVEDVEEYDEEEGVVEVVALDDVEDEVDEDEDVNEVDYEGDYVEEVEELDDDIKQIVVQIQQQIN